MDNHEESINSWGGYRPGAGNKYKWQHGETKAVRIPISIIDQVLEIAKLIDAGHEITVKEEQPKASLDITKLKTYKLHGRDVVRVDDLMELLNDET